MAMKPNYRGDKYRKVWRYNGIRQEVTSSSEAGMWERYHDRQKALENGDIIVNKNTTVKRWVEQWLETDKKPAVGKRTFTEIESLLKNSITKDIGHMRLHEVKRINLQKVLNDRAGKSFSHVSKIKIYISELFDAAERDEIIIRSPARHLIMPETTRGTARAMTDEEYTAALELCKTHRAGLFVRLLLMCGLRRGEAIPLTWSDINFKKQTLTINKAAEFIKGRQEVKDGAKTDAGNRTIKIEDETLTALKIAKDKSKSILIFPSPVDSGLMCEWHVDKMWKNFLRELDIALGAELHRNEIVKSIICPGDDSIGLRLHSLRHTCITKLITNGANVKDVQLFAGHANVQTTLDIYAQVEKEAAASRIYNIQSGTNGGTVEKKADSNA